MATPAVSAGTWRCENVTEKRSLGDNKKDFTQNCPEVSQSGVTSLSSSVVEVERLCAVCCQVVIKLHRSDLLEHPAVCFDQQCTRTFLIFLQKYFDKS